MNRLSFSLDEEDDEEPMALSKPPARKPSKKKGRRRERSKLGASGPPAMHAEPKSTSEGSYSTEALAELKRGTPSLRRAEPEHPEGDDEGVVGVETLEDAAARMKREIHLRRLLAEGKSEARKIQGGTASADFIPLDSRVDVRGGIESGIVRDDADDAEPDLAYDAPQSTRLRFGDPGKESKPSISADWITAQQGGDESGSSEDEAVRDWELEQLRKAGVKVNPVGSAASLARQAAQPRGAITGAGAMPALMGSPPATAVVLPVAPLPSASSTSLPASALAPARQRVADVEVDIDDPSYVPPTADALMSVLHRALDTAKDRLRLREDSLKRLDARIAVNEEHAQAMEEKFFASSKQYVFFQEAQQDLSDLCECLEEKVPMIDHCEEKAWKLRRRFFADAHAQQQHEILQAILDVRDPACPPMDHLASELGVDAARFTAEERQRGYRARGRRHAQRRTAERVQVTGPGEGWSSESESELVAPSAIPRAALPGSSPRVSGAKRPAASAPEGEGIAFAPSTTTLHTVEGEGGQPSLEQLQEERANRLRNFEAELNETKFLSRGRFVEWHEDILDEASRIFTDTAERYSALRSVKEFFETWKFSFPQQYKDAYVSLTAPQLFAIYVRREMLWWNPLRTTDFGEFEWFRTLFEYGIEEGKEPDPDDEDSLLIPLLVENILLPIVTEVMQHIYDPLSKSQTHQALELVKTFLIFLPPTKDVVQRLFLTVIDRFRTRGNGLYIPPFLSRGDTSDIHKLSRRLFWRSLKLLHNLREWAEFIDPQLLEELAGELVTARFVPFLQDIAHQLPLGVFLDYANKVVDQLPREWWASPGMARFADLVQAFSAPASRVQRYPGIEARLLARTMLRMQRPLDVVRTFCRQQGIECDFPELDTFPS